MNGEEIERTLAGSGLAAWRYLDSVDSTNSEAFRWLGAGAPARCLVLADHQSAGRGRMGRKWATPAGTALALSLLLKAPLTQDGATQESTSALQRLTGLGAVALAEVLEEKYGLHTQIKWPNDVLVAGNKIAGILVEAHWMGEKLEGVVIGIGVNVLKGAVPPPETLAFPAASLEDYLLAKTLDRLTLLRNLVDKLLAWLPRTGTEEFLRTWESRLAWRGERVQVLQMVDNQDHASTVQGSLTGLDEAGHLCLLSDSGEMHVVEAGDLSLRLLD